MTGPSILMRLVNLFPDVGRAEGFAAYAFVDGNERGDSKVILHELLHLLGAGHSFSGVMFPVSEFLFFANGMSNSTAKEINGN